MRYAILSLLALFLCPLPGLAVQPADVVVFAYQNVLRLAARSDIYEGDREFQAYAWISLVDPKLKAQCYLTVSGHTQFISLGQQVVPPVLILSDGREFRFPTLPAGEDWEKAVLIRWDIRDYKWSREQWDKLGNPDLNFIFQVWQQQPWKGGVWPGDGLDYAAGAFKVAVPALAPHLVEPFGLTKEQPARDVAIQKYLKAVIGLSKECGYSKSPLVEADNFIWQSAIDFDRPAGYYSWLNIKSKADFDKLGHVDEKIKPLFEAVSKSGVAQEPRGIARFGRADGAWYTLDQVNGRGVRERDPLQVVDRRKLKFDAFEAFIHLDNGFWAMGLFKNDGKGTIQQSAPDGIGYFHQAFSNDGRIHVYLTCLACHDRNAGNGGLHPFQPFFRTLYRDPGPLALINFRKDYKRFDQEYLTPLDDLADLDRRQYGSALVQANGLAPHVYAEYLVESFKRWERPVDRARAAQLYGVSEAELVKGLESYLHQYGTIDSINGNWIKDDKNRQRIGINQFAQNYSLGHLELRRLPTWPITLELMHPKKP